jgi:hypothetical protein
MKAAKTRMAIAGLGAFLLAAILPAGCSKEKDGETDKTDGATIAPDASQSEELRIGPGCVSSQDCPADRPYCDQATNTCVECKKNEHCLSLKKPYCNPITTTCVECLMNEHCKSELLFCLEGQCSDTACIPNLAKCVGNTVHVCSADGLDPDYSTIDCGELKCHDGNCLECIPDQVSCKGHDIIQCHADGKNYDVLESCIPPQDCFAAKCQVCYPGNKKCEGNLAMVCNLAGSGWEPKQDCSQAGLSCYMGACLSPCAGDLKQNTNAGCEFFAVDLDNYQSLDNDAFNSQYAVIVSNTSKEAQAEVTVTLPDGTPLAAVVPANSLHKFELPPTWGVNDTMVGMNAFKVSSNRPITVYQFNPLSNVVEVFSNDASVLLPTPALGNEYYVLTYGFGGAKVQTESTPASYFTVVGVSSIPTQVTFTVTAATLAGGPLGALNPGETATVELKQGEVLSVSTSQPSADLTGTHITATAPIAVFGGHECPYTADRCCCDHLEEQIVPLKTWGTHYVISKSWERWKEKDYVRILASQDNTHVSLNPAIVTVPALNAGQQYTFQSTVNLEVTADRPILVAQYLTSSFEILGDPFSEPCEADYNCPTPYVCDFWSGACVGPTCNGQANCPPGHTCENYPEYGESYCEAIGDPAMILAVSEQQFMESYVFLTPDAYLKDYLNVIAPLDAGKVVLDDMQINPASFAAVGSSGYGVFRTEILDGVHTIWSDRKIGIVVYGYDNDVSYGYPGGMGLKELTF